MNVKDYLISGLVAILIFGIGFWCGVRSNRATVDTVRVELDNVRENQRTITDTITDIASNVNEAGRIISECQQTIRDIRKQPKTEIAPKQVKG